MEQTLQYLLYQMDIPKLRRDTSDPANVRWLLRNLPIHNQKHPQLSLVMQKLKINIRGGSE